MSFDNEFHTEELNRRTIQIDDLKEELADLKWRVEDADERRGQLQQGIESRTLELQERKAKTQELLDQASAEEAQGESAARTLAAHRTAGVAEVASLRQKLAELDQVQTKAHAELDETRKLVSKCGCEVHSKKGRVEALQRDAEIQRQELERDEAEEDRRRRAPEQRRSTARLSDAQEALDGSSREADAANTELARLESALMMEKECGEGLATAITQTQEKKLQVEQECAALAQELKNLEDRGDEEELLEKLTISKMRYQHLAQDLANAKRHNLMQTQNVQGALDETRRMMSDHLDQTRKHLEETKVSSSDSSVAVLIAALGEAKQATADARERNQSVERQCEKLEAEVREAEVALGDARKEALRYLEAQQRQDLTNSRLQLNQANRRATLAQEDLRRLEDAVVETENLAKEQVRLLRLKLEELRGAIRQLGAGQGLFTPPPRG